MKYITFICLFILVFNHLSFSQSFDKKNDSLVYLCVVNHPGSNYENIPISDSTSLTIFKKVEFKNTNLNKWHGTDIISGWKEFFNQINIDTLKEYKLTINKIGSHLFVIKDIKKARDYKQPSLSLSPVIYSADKTLAICSVFMFFDPDTETETVYLLQYKGGEWKIVKFLLVSMS